MKKLGLPAPLLLIAAALSGCPLYDDEGCTDCGRQCADGYTLDAAGDCVKPSCSQPSDCDANETCNQFGTCSTGDCHYESVGCVSGYLCSSESGRWECVAEGSVGGGAGAPASGAAGATSTAGAAGSP